MPRILPLIAAALAATALANSARAGCPDDEAVAAMADDMVAVRAVTPPDAESVADGMCLQGELVARLTEHWGAPIGYKAGLTSAAAQHHFGLDAPVSGVLLAGMMRADGALVPIGYGYAPRLEADFIVVVADAGINQATTPAEALAHVSAVHPFIELPDLMVAQPADLTGPTVVALNAGARMGVLGAAIPVADTPDVLAALARMTVTATDQHGTVLASGTGSDVLGHPLNAALWLARSGIQLQPGDLVSVGAFGTPLEPHAGQTVTVTYDGLPGNPSVSVTFK